MEQNTIRISFSQVFDNEISEEEIREWAEFKLGISESISLNNSLIDTDLDGFCLEVAG